MPTTDIGDPRLQALFGAANPRDAGVRPTVRLPGKGLPPAVIAVVAVVLALLLFLILNERRTAQPAPAVRAPFTGTTAWEAPPPLYVPPVSEPATVTPPTEKQPIISQVPKASPPVSARTVAAAPVYVPQPAPQIAPMTAPSAPPPRPSAGTALVIDNGGATSGSAASAAPPAGGQPSSIAAIRVRASSFANRATTVPQGHLIPAVLETGFNSTQPGFARAIVSRDVRSFDGTNILIPRGSRLIGEYQVAVDKSQKRAMIIWTRLIRPDGLTIAMDSPAVDTLGRGGVPASVNTHFFQRFGDALLQSAVDIGRAFAGRAVTGPVVVLPGNNLPATGQLTSSNSYVPTLTVAAGKSISVFVAHDLDFSTAGTGP